MIFSFLFISRHSKYSPHFFASQNEKSFIMKTPVYLMLLVFCCMILSGCDKISDNVVSQQALDYQITGITAPDTVNYAAKDSVVTNIFTNQQSGYCTKCMVLRKFIRRQQRYLFPGVAEHNYSRNRHKPKYDEFLGLLL